MNALQESVDSNKAKVAFGFFPVSIEQLKRVADTNNIKVMPLTIFVAGNDDRSGFLFNRATFELKDIGFSSDRGGRERNKTYKEFIKDSTALKTDESIGYYATDYICQLYLSNKP